MNRFLRVGCSVHRPEAGLRLVIRLLVLLRVFECPTYSHGARMSSMLPPKACTCLQCTLKIIISTIPNALGEILTLLQM